MSGSWRSASAGRGADRRESRDREGWLWAGFPVLSGGSQGLEEGRPMPALTFTLAPHSVTSSQAAEKSSGDQRGVLGCGSWPGREQLLDKGCQTRKATPDSLLPTAKK